MADVPPCRCWIPRVWDKWQAPSARQASSWGCDAAKTAVIGFSVAASDQSGSLSGSDSGNSKLQDPFLALL